VETFHLKSSIGQQEGSKNYLIKVILDVDEIRLENFTS